MRFRVQGARRMWNEKWGSASAIVPQEGRHSSSALSHLSFCFVFPPLFTGEMKASKHRKSTTTSCSRWWRTPPFCAPQHGERGGVGEGQMPPSTRLCMRMMVRRGSNALNCRRFFSSSSSSGGGGRSSSSSNNHKTNRNSIPIVNYYKRLNISPTASSSEIKRAYRQLALRYHPDVAVYGGSESGGVGEDGEGGSGKETERGIKNQLCSSSSSSSTVTTPPLSKAEAEAAFRSISEAYAVLSDPEARRKHDETLQKANVWVKKQKKEEEKGEEERKSSTSTTRSSSHSSHMPRQTSRRTTTSNSTTTTCSRSRDRGSKSSSSFASNTTTTSSTTFSSSFGFSSSFQQNKKKIFVRRDADRIFREAFNGKTLEEVLFHARRRAKQMANNESARLHREGGGGGGGAGGETKNSSESMNADKQKDGKSEKDSRDKHSSSSSTSNSTSRARHHHHHHHYHSPLQDPHSSDSWMNDKNLRQAMEMAAQRLSNRMQQAFGPSRVFSRGSGSSSASILHVRHAARMMEASKSLHGAATAAAAAVAAAGGGGAGGEGEEGVHSTTNHHHHATTTTSPSHHPRRTATSSAAFSPFSLFSSSSLPVPGTVLPFRPFPNMVLPKGVRVPPDPAMGKWEYADVVEKEGIPVLQKTPSSSVKRKKREQVDHHKTHPRTPTTKTTASSGDSSERTRQDLREEEEKTDSSPFAVSDTGGKGVMETAEAGGAPSPPSSSLSPSSSTPAVISPSSPPAPLLTTVKRLRVTITTKARRPVRRKHEGKTKPSLLRPSSLSSTLQAEQKRTLPPPQACDPWNEEAADTAAGASSSSFAAAVCSAASTKPTDGHEMVVEGEEKGSGDNKSTSHGTRTTTSSSISRRHSEEEEVEVGEEEKDTEDQYEEEEWEEVPREEEERLSKRSNALRAFRCTSFADRRNFADRLTNDCISHDSGRDRSVPYNMGQLYSYHRPY